MNRRNFLGAAAAALAVQPGAARAQPAAGAAAPAGPDAALRERLEAARPPAGLDAEARDALAQFYGKREFRPAFVADGRWSDGARALIARLAQARADGFAAEDYARASFPRGGRDQPIGDAADAELDLAGAVLAYARHAARGRIDIRRLAPFVVATPAAADLDAVLTGAAGAAPVAALEALHPKQPGFLALRRALGALIAAERAPAARAPEGPPIPAGAPMIRLGASDPRVPMLRDRFALAAAAAGNRDKMDLALVAAVRAFQQSRGLEVTGVVGPSTIRALNGEPATDGAAERRIAQLVVNMERWRWLPRELGERHIWVNVPEYLVKVIDGGRQIFAARTVVGKRETPTPVFSNAMQYFVVNPSWTVPPGIARRDFFPLLASDPEALARRGIEVVRTARGGTVFRQPPGERNALGRIKFMFPNEHAIYLHDTPARGYFQRDRRMFSNGCVRVDDPLRFAEAAFAKEGNVSARSITALYGGPERHVRLRHRVPVHLAYFTVEIDPEGRTRNLEDVYGLDARMMQLLGMA